MTASTLHIVFSQSAAGSLRQALHDAGREDGVAGYFDNLALGPLNPFDLPTRLHWVDEELHRGADEWWGHAEEDTFWKTALVEDVRKVAWISRRSASEYCGFLEWLWRLGDLPCEIVDLADMPVGNHRRAFTLAMLSPKEIETNAVWGRAKALDAIARSQCHRLWRRLRLENAPLRVVDRDGLRSAPITFFDQQLLSYAKDSWQKSGRIIGETISDWVFPPMEPQEPYFQPDERFLAARIIALVELGILEGRGNLMNMRQSDVRLPDHALRGDVGTG